MTLQSLLAHVSPSSKPQGISSFVQPAVRSEIAHQVFLTSYGSEAVTPTQRALLAKPEWAEKAFREAYVCAAVEQGIAWQVRINREKRGLSQKQLAKAIGTKQSAISRMEAPEYGAHSLPQLLKVANALDVALIVKLAGFSMLARESGSLSESHVYAKSYDEEILGS